MKHYDYIFAGAGLAALMTVYKMAESGAFGDKSILLVDEDAKKSNDRTWCFWDKGTSLWQGSVSKTWERAAFAGADFRRTMDLAPYRYQMIRGVDFYNQVFAVILKQDNITFLNEKVVSIEGNGGRIVVGTAGESYSCGKVFNSIYRKSEVEGKKKYPFLQQHFVGWFIKSDAAVFDPGVATIMDFSIAQKGNTRFMYVLAMSETEALVEYTLFSKDLLKESEYEEAIEEYIGKLGIVNYKVLEKERGSIPMTCYPFWKKDTADIIHIGSAGGWTKASTGYTFRNADKRSDELVAFLKKGKRFGYSRGIDRFWLYDLLLLDILYRCNAVGSRIFSSLFRKEKVAVIFRFLDEESSLLDDVRVISRCPKGLFAGALLRRLLGR